MSRKRKIALFAGVPIVLAASAFAFMSRGGKSDLIEVETMPVEARRIVQTVVATGRIQPVTQINISADVSAKITRLAVKEGDWVESGQFLLELDRERYLAEVESAEANLRSSEVGRGGRLLEHLDKAVKDLARVQALHGKSLESASNLDAAALGRGGRQGPPALRAGPRLANRAALSSRRDALSKTTIYAPSRHRLEAQQGVGEIALGSRSQEDTILEPATWPASKRCVGRRRERHRPARAQRRGDDRSRCSPRRHVQGQGHRHREQRQDRRPGDDRPQKTEFEVKVAILDPGSQLAGMTARHRRRSLRGVLASRSRSVACAPAARRGGEGRRPLRPPPMPVQATPRRALPPSPRRRLRAGSSRRREQVHARQVSRRPERAPASARRGCAPPVGG